MLDLGFDSYHKVSKIQKQYQRFSYLNKDIQVLFHMITSKNIESNKQGIDPLNLNENICFKKCIHKEMCEKNYEDYYPNITLPNSKYSKFSTSNKNLFLCKQITKNQYQALRDVEMYLEKKNEKIVQLTYALIKENIANKLIFIGGYNELYGIKIIRSEYYYPKQFIDSKENWIPAWHGTKFESLQSIMELGLKLPGTKLPNGTEIKPLEGHIDRYVEVNDDKDWAKGIFVSQSIFYSACEVYGRIIKSLGIEWIVLIETRVRMGSFKTRGSTVTDYKLIEGEPENLEFKVENESDVVVVGILFLNKNLIKNIKKYKYGSFFVTSNEEIFMNSDDLYTIEEIKINSIKFNFNILMKENIYIDYIDSKILCNDILYQEKIKQWLNKPNSKSNYKNLENISLLYRGSRDGFKASDFHRLCDNKGETLVIIKSTDNYIFGGYTSINWESTKWNGQCGEKNNARREGHGLEFIFTLKNPHNIPPSKYNIQKKWLDHSICCDINLGPIFGCNDIRIENNCNTNSNSFSYYDFNPGEYCFDDTTGKKRMLFTGSSTYKVEEIEVFKIEKYDDNFGKIMMNDNSFYRNEKGYLKKYNYYDYDYEESIL